MHGEIDQCTRRIGDFEDEVARICQECDLEVEDVHSKRDSLQVRLDATDLLLLKVRSSLAVAHGKLEHHRGRSAISHFWLESLLVSFVSGSIDRIVAW